MPEVTGFLNGVGVADPREAGRHLITANASRLHRVREGPPIKPYRRPVYGLIDDPLRRGQVGAGRGQGPRRSGPAAARRVPQRRDACQLFVRQPAWCRWVY
jgi:hypothetical protein